MTPLGAAVSSPPFSSPGQRDPQAKGTQTGGAGPTRSRGRAQSGASGSHWPALASSGYVTEPARDQAAPEPYALCRGAGSRANPASGQELPDPRGPTDQRRSHSPIPPPPSHPKCSPPTHTLAGNLGRLRRSWYASSSPSPPHCPGPPALNPQ